MSLPIVSFVFRFRFTSDVGPVVSDFFCFNLVNIESFSDNFSQEFHQAELNIGRNYKYHRCRIWILSTSFT